MFHLILKKNVIENLWRHVFRSSHRELPQIGEEKTASKIDKFQRSNVGVVGAESLSFASDEHNILCFEVRMDNIVAVDKGESFCNFSHKSDQFLLIGSHSE